MKNIFRSGTFVGIFSAVVILVGISTQFAYGDTVTSTPARVQSAHDSSAGVATFTSPVTTGNTVIVGVTVWQSTIAANDITDNKGNAYTLVAESVNATSGDHAAIFYAKNVIGGASFTVTSLVGGTVSIHEYSGLSTSTPFDKTASAIGFSNAPKSGSVTAASSNELYFGLAWSGGDGDAWTTGAGYTLRETETNNNANERLATEDMVLSTASTTSALFTTGTNSDWIAMVATFKPQVLVSGTTPPPATTTPPLPPASKPTIISSFTASPTAITSGQSSTLTWNIANASTTSIDNGVGAVTGTSKVVTPTATTTYTITATNPQGSATSSVTVSVVHVVVTPPPPAPKPTISSFTATPANITSGQSSTLAWSIANASTTSIDNGVGVVTGTSKVVSPTATTTYTITATNPQGSVTAITVVTVAPVVVTPPPSNSLITNGNFEAGTTGNPTGWTHDFWGNANPTFTYPVIGNGGGKAAQITISRTGTINGAANWIFSSVSTNAHTQYQYTEDYTANVATELDVEYLMSNGTYKYDWLVTLPASASWTSVKAQVTPPTGAVSFDVLHILAKKGTVSIDNASLSAINDPFPQGMVSFTFDDGLLSPYQNALPILKVAGFNAGFYIITTEPTSGDSGYMTWPQIKDLQSKGYEIGGHTRTHPFLSTLTPAQLTNEVSGSYSDLMAQGITPKSFVYPYGDESSTVEAAVKTAGYNLSRGSYTGQNGTVTNHYSLYDIRVDSTTSLATIESYIDQAKADHRWLVLELHDVVASGGDVDAITPAYFQSLVTYIKNSGIQVSTMQQALAQMNP
jgi:peptidoglycan/xylan/chitin deacetylase (PgdA/CDA1 family)